LAAALCPLTDCPEPPRGRGVTGPGEMVAPTGSPCHGRKRNGHRDALVGGQLREVLAVLRQEARSSDSDSENWTRGSRTGSVASPSRRCSSRLARSQGLSSLVSTGVALASGVRRDGGGAHSACRRSVAAEVHPLNARQLMEAVPEARPPLRRPPWPPPPHHPGEAGPPPSSRRSRPRPRSRDEGRAPGAGAVGLFEAAVQQHAEDGDVAPCIVSRDGWRPRHRPDLAAPRGPLPFRSSGPREERRVSQRTASKIPIKVCFTRFTPFLVKEPIHVEGVDILARHLPLENPLLAELPARHGDGPALGPCSSSSACTLPCQLLHDRFERVQPPLHPSPAGSRSLARHELHRRSGQARLVPAAGPPAQHELMPLPAAPRGSGRWSAPAARPERHHRRGRPRAATGRRRFCSRRACLDG